MRRAFGARVVVRVGLVVAAAAGVLLLVAGSAVAEAVGVAVPAGEPVALVVTGAAVGTGAIATSIGGSGHAGVGGWWDALAPPVSLGLAAVAGLAVAAMIVTRWWSQRGRGSALRLSRELLANATADPVADLAAVMTGALRKVAGAVAAGRRWVVATAAVAWKWVIDAFGRSSSPRSTTFESLKKGNEPNFRKYAIGRMVSLLGFEMQYTAQIWLVLELTGGDYVALALVSFMPFVPRLLGLLWGGSIADRSDKRRILMRADLASGVIAASLGVLILTDLIALGHVYVAAVLTAVVAASATPARGSFVKELVSKERLANALALTSVLTEIAYILGPVIALLATVVNPGWLFLANAASYGVAILSLLKLKRERVAPRERVARLGFAELRSRFVALRRHVHEGVRYVRQRPELAAVLLLYAITAVFGRSLALKLPLLAGAIGAGPATAALLTAAVGTGSVFGALLAARRVEVASVWAVVGWGLGFGALITFAGLMPAIWLTASLLVVAGVVDRLFANLADHRVQQVDDDMTARVVSLRQLLMTGVPLTAPLIGLAAEWQGGRAPTWMGGVIAVVGVLGVAWWLRHELRAPGRAGRAIPRRLHLRWGGPKRAPPRNLAQLLAAAAEHRARMREIPEERWSDERRTVRDNAFAELDRIAAELAAQGDDHERLLRAAGERLAELHRLADERPGSRLLDRTQRINLVVFLIGEGLYTLGVTLLALAQNWLVLGLAGAGVMALVNGLRFGPMTGSFWAGSWADRFDKRRILMLAEPFVVLVVLGLGLLTETGGVRLWSVLVAAGVVGTVSAITWPTRQAMVPELVGEDRRASVVALVGMVRSAGLVVAPLVGGLLIVAVGTGWTLLVSAGVLGASILTLILLRTAALSPSPVAERGRGQLRIGFDYVRKRADLVRVLTLVVLGTLLVNVSVTLPIVAGDVFAAGPSAFGLLNSALSVGALVGGLVVQRWVVRRGGREHATSDRIVLGSAALVGGLMAVVGLMPDLAWAVGVVVLTGVALGVFNTTTMDRMLAVPGDMRGRVTGLHTTLVSGVAPPAAGLWVGATAEWFGGRVPIILGGLLTVAAVLLVGWPRARWVTTRLVIVLATTTAMVLLLPLAAAVTLFVIGAVAAVLRCAQRFRGFRGSSSRPVAVLAFMTGAGTLLSAAFGGSPHARATTGATRPAGVDSGWADGLWAVLSSEPAHTAALLVASVGVGCFLVRLVRLGLGARGPPPAPAAVMPGRDLVRPAGPSRTDGGAFVALRVIDARWFLGAQMFATTGAWMLAMAQEWLVLDLTRDYGAVGLAATLQFGPMLLSAVAGVLADMYDQRRLVGTAQIVAGVAAAAMGVIALTGVPQLWMLYAMAAVTGLVLAVLQPTQDEYLGRLVGPALRANANALNLAVVSISRIAGAALGGLLLHALGAGWMYLLNAAAFGVVLLMLRAIKRDSGPVTPTERTTDRMDRADRPRVAVLGEIRERVAELLRYVWRDRVLRGVLLLVTLMSGLGWNTGVTLPLLAGTVFDGGPLGLALLSGALALGMLAGSLWSARRATRDGGSRPRLRLVFGAAFAFAGLQAASGLMPGLVITSVVTAAFGVAAMTYFSSVSSYVALAASDDMRSRVTGLYWVVAFLLTPIAPSLLGAIGGFHPRAPTLASAAGAALGALVAIVLVNRALRAVRAARQPDVPHADRARRPGLRSLLRRAALLTAAAVVLLVLSRLVRAGTAKLAAQLARLRREQRRGGRGGTASLPLLHEIQQEPGGSRPDGVPQQVASWWAQLSPHTRERLAREEPQRLGRLDGLPDHVRDTINREQLALATEELAHQLASMPPLRTDSPETVRERERISSLLLGVDATTAFLREAERAGRTARLLAFDTVGRGHAVLALGDIENADHVALVVPGMAHQLGTINSAAWRLKWLWDAVHAVDANPRTAFVAFWDYDMPPWFRDATAMDAAEAAVPRLASFIEGLRAIRGDRPLHLTVVAHSYGTIAVALALLRQRGLLRDGDDLVLVGSPGIPAAHASRLHAPERTWASGAERDPITYVAGLVGLTDPRSPGFGANVYDAGSGGDAVYFVHETYFREPEPLRRLALIVLGRGHEVELLGRERTVVARIAERLRGAGVVGLARLLLGTLAARAFVQKRRARARERTEGRPATSATTAIEAPADGGTYPRKWSAGFGVLPAFLPPPGGSPWIGWLADVVQTIAQAGLFAAVVVLVLWWWSSHKDRGNGSRFRIVRDEELFPTRVQDLEAHDDGSASSDNSMDREEDPHRIGPQERFLGWLGEHAASVLGIALGVLVALAVDPQAGAVAAVLGWPLDRGGTGRETVHRLIDQLGDVIDGAALSAATRRRLSDALARLDVDRHALAAVVDILGGAGEAGPILGEEWVLRNSVWGSVTQPGWYPSELGASLERVRAAARALLLRREALRDRLKSGGTDSPRLLYLRLPPAERYSGGLGSADPTQTLPSMPASQDGIVSEAHHDIVAARAALSRGDPDAADEILFAARRRTGLNDEVREAWREVAAQRVATALRRAGVGDAEFAVIGGIAVRARTGQPRKPKDVDIAVQVDDLARRRRIVHELASSGIHVDDLRTGRFEPGLNQTVLRPVEDSERTAPLTAALVRTHPKEDPRGVAVELFFDALGPEQMLVRSANHVEGFRVASPIASTATLIVSKMVDPRSKDLRDIDDLLHAATRSDRAELWDLIEAIGERGRNWRADVRAGVSIPDTGRREPPPPEQR